MLSRGTSWRRHVQRDGERTPGGRPGIGHGGGCAEGEPEYGHRRGEGHKTAREGGGEISAAAGHGFFQAHANLAVLRHQCGILLLQRHGQVCRGETDARSRRPDAELKLADTGAATLGAAICRALAPQRPRSPTALVVFVLALACAIPHHQRGSFAILPEADLELSQSTFPCHLTLHGVTLRPLVPICKLAIRAPVHAQLGSVALLDLDQGRLAHQACEPRGLRDEALAGHVPGAAGGTALGPSRPLLHDTVHRGPAVATFGVLLTRTGVAPRDLRRRPLARQASIRAVTYDGAAVLLVAVAGGRALGGLPSGPRSEHAVLLDDGPGRLARDFRAARPVLPMIALNCLATIVRLDPHDAGTRVHTALATTDAALLPRLPIVPFTIDTRFRIASTRTRRGRGNLFDGRWKARLARALGLHFDAPDAASVAHAAQLGLEALGPS
mmetsp:Transcript_86549/g.279353  ORF Transcript_86549/g.279353 Transcript_86549/m.279353 type:complete len:442 (+) Transcript_86549:280-1605(+)